MVWRGERPGNRVVQLPSGDWSVEGLPGVEVTRASLKDAPDIARTVIASVLEVPTDAFDVEIFSA
jgi:hypothetical protein